MSGQVEVARRTLRKIAHSIMVHARVLEAYIHFALMYTTYHIFTVLPIKYMINKNRNRTTEFKLATGTKTTAHVEKKELNMRHQAQKSFRDIFVGITQHQKGYIVYVLSKRKIRSSYDVVFDESFSSALAYTPRPYA